MTKNIMGTKLPRKLDQKMQVMEEQIKLVRLRRNLSVAQVAEQATCSLPTVSRIEKGYQTVVIGIYLRVLFGCAAWSLRRILLLCREQITALEDGRSVRRLLSFNFLADIDDFSQIGGSRFKEAEDGDFISMNEK